MVRLPGPFLSAERVAGGVAWWLTNDDALAPPRRNGRAAEIVVAIVGIETRYGRAHRVVPA